MSPRELEDALRNLRRLGTLLRRDPVGETWRIDLLDRPRIVHFHPRSSPSARGLALRRFTNLQLLQKAGIPAPRAVAHLVGYRLDEDTGDAVLTDACDDVVPLDSLPADRWQDHAFHRRLVAQATLLLRKLGEAKLGHAALDRHTLGLRDDALVVLDPMPLRRGGLTMRDLFSLHHACHDIVTRTDLLRVWRIVAPGSQLPRRNPLAEHHARELGRAARRGRGAFVRLASDGWSIVFSRAAPARRPWSIVSRLELARRDVLDAFRDLLGRLESDQLDVLKDDRGGMILSGELVLAGRPVPVIVKRPRRRGWKRLLEFGSFSRAARTWSKSWTMVGLDVPCEQPILLARRSTIGVDRDGLLVFERVPGTVLATFDLDSLAPGRRRTLLHRCGGALRRINAAGFENYDAKSYNWIVYSDHDQSAVPVMIDLDGIRSYRWFDFGLKRLARALRVHPRCRDADLVCLARGYAPFATISRLAKLCRLEEPLVLRIERGGP